MGRVTLVFAIVLERPLPISAKQALLKRGRGVLLGKGSSSPSGCFPLFGGSLEYTPDEPPPSTGCMCPRDSALGGTGLILPSGSISGRQKGFNPIGSPHLLLFGWPSSSPDPRQGQRKDAH